MQASVRNWLAAMPPPRFERPGRGASGAFDHRGRDEDVPELKEARAPLPRGNLPAHETPGSVETGADEDDIAERAHELIKSCVEQGIDTGQLEQVVEAMFPARGAGDAGPEPQHQVDDQEPLEDEVIERVLAHMRGRMSDSALDGLRDMLTTRADDNDPVPAFLRGREGEVERLIEGKDPRSTADLKEVYDAFDGIAASEMMRQRGAFEPGSGTRMGDLRRGREGKRGASDQPPPFPGRPTPGGAPLPGRQERYGIDRKTIAADMAMKKKAVGRRLQQLSRGV
jgi:hypothetical protein